MGAEVCEFLAGTSWRQAVCAPLTGDASARRYFRLRADGQTAMLMDASRARECVAPFHQLALHLRRLGFSAPEVFHWCAKRGLMLIEDFGEQSFTRLLDGGAEEEPLYALATDVLAALHQQAGAVPARWRVYDPQKMLEDLELFLEWRAPGLASRGRAAFCAAWRQVLPLAHRVPQSLLLRDYHVANLMLLPEREGLRRAGLLDFQDAYAGPVTYDLVSLLQDARRELPEPLQATMLARYLAACPAPSADDFAASLAILAAQRHTRVLGIFERLSLRDGKHEYKRRHSPRVERLLRRALEHPALGPVKNWFSRYAD